MHAIRMLSGVGGISQVMLMFGVAWALGACAADTTGNHGYYSQNVPAGLNEARLNQPGHMPYAPNSPGYLPARTADQKGGMVTQGGATPVPEPGAP